MCLQTVSEVSTLSVASLHSSKHSLETYHIFCICLCLSSATPVCGMQLSINISVNMKLLLLHTGKNLKEVAITMDVAKYLQHLKLEMYVETFEKEEVDGELLWDICHAKGNELKDLGVYNDFHCMKIKNKLEKYLSKLD